MISQFRTSSTEKPLSVKTLRYQSCNALVRHAVMVFFGFCKRCVAPKWSTLVSACAEGTPPKVFLNLSTWLMLFTVSFFTWSLWLSGVPPFTFHLCNNASKKLSIFTVLEPPEVSHRLKIVGSIGGNENNVANLSRLKASVPSSLGVMVPK